MGLWRGVRGWMHIHHLILGQCQPWSILFLGRGKFLVIYDDDIFSGDIVTTCGSGSGSRIRSGVEDGVLEIGGK